MPRRNNNRRRNSRRLNSRVVDYIAVRNAANGETALTAAALKLDFTRPLRVVWVTVEASTAASTPVVMWITGFDAQSEEKWNSPTKLVATGTIARFRYRVPKLTDFALFIAGSTILKISTTGAVTTTVKFGVEYGPPVLTPSSFAEELAM